MKKIIKKVISILLVVSLLFSYSQQVKATSRITIYEKKGWKVVYDSPDNSKTYPHLHFYKNKTHIYCLRLDNLKSCDGTDKNRNKVPKDVMKSVMKNNKVKSTLKKYQPKMFSGNVLKKVKPLIVAGASIGVIVATANVFAGPVDDVAAWAALSAALGL